MTTAEELFDHAQELLDEGRSISAVEALEEGRQLAKDPSQLAWASYNLGVTHWARLGNGDAARREFNAVIAIFDEHGSGNISKRFRGMLPYALDNAMLLALSFDEFERLAARVKVLTPRASTVTKLTPETLRARDEGQPWSDQLFKIAETYYNRNDPSQDRGRYGEARATYQLLLNHRRELRLARHRWRMATYELAALSLRMASDSMQAHGGYSGTYSSEEFLPILADAIPLIDDYLAANPGDDTVEKVRRGAERFVVDIRESWADRAHRVEMLNNQGVELLERREFQAALPLFEEAEAISLEIGDKEKLQACIGNKALVAANTGDPDRALELIAQKEKICHEIGFQSGLANALASKAAILASVGRTDAAFASAKQAYRICKKYGLDQLAQQLAPLLQKPRRAVRHAWQALPSDHRSASSGQTDHSSERANRHMHISRNPYKMIMMKCPKTGKVVKTGVNSRYFEQWQDNPPAGGASFTCPECNQKHTFDKSNTWLEDL